MSVSAQGLDQLVESLRAAGDELENLDPEKPATDSAQRAEATAPRHTGYLASTVGWLATSTGFTVTATAPYAVPVHARNPWIARTLQDNTEQTATDYQHAAQAVLDDVRGT